MTESLLDKPALDKVELDPNRDYLEELIGVGGKFYDPDRNKALQAMARGKAESDLTIPHLTARMDELRTDLLETKKEAMASTSLKELADRLAAQQRLASNDDMNEVDTQIKPQFDINQLEDRVAKEVMKIEASKKEAENQKMVAEKLLERYGNNYHSAIQTPIDSLGISKERFDELVRTSPQLVLRTLGLDKAPERDPFQSPIKSDVRSDSFAPKGPAKRTWSYYQDIRKKDPALYHDPKTYNQMLKDAKELGAAFQDGSWNS